MHDYRNLYTGFVDYTEDKNKSLCFNLNYKQPLATIFMNAYVDKVWTEKHQTTQRDFVGEYIINTYYADKSYAEALDAGGRISKGLSFMRGQISIAFDYMNSNGTMRQKNVATEYSSDNYSWNVKFNGSPVEWFNFTYNIDWNKSLMKMKNADLESTTSDRSQQIMLNFVPVKQWQIKLTGDYFNNQVTENQHKELFLADVSTSYSLNNGMELNLMSFNIFNQRSYGYTDNGNLTRMSKEYKLRARTIMASVFWHF